MTVSVMDRVRLATQLSYLERARLGHEAHRAARAACVEELAPQLAELADWYRAARTVAIDGARYSVETVPFRTCRYCGRAWNGSPYMDGHAMCIVTPAFAQAVTDTWWSSPKLSRRVIADALGVSQGAVNAWTRTRRIEVARCR